MNAEALGHILKRNREPRASPALGNPHAPFPGLVVPADGGRPPRPLSGPTPGRGRGPERKRGCGGGAEEGRVLQSPGELGG